MSSTPVENLLGRLEKVQAAGKGYKACCPAHDDRNPSLSISEGDDGRALVKCFAGCTVEEICDAVGLRVADLMPEQNPSTSTIPQPNAQQGGFRGRRQQGQSTFNAADEAIAERERKFGPTSRRWTYEDQDGETVGYVLRWDRSGDDKVIRPIAKHGDGWVFGAMPEPRPLYRLSHLAGSDVVYVVEGEKAADAALSIGLTVTTSAGGCKAAAKSDWSPLAGKSVVILPDNDDAGFSYADEVAETLSKLSPPATVRIVELPKLDDGDDIADWLDMHDAVEPETLRARVEQLASTAKPFKRDPGEPPFEPFRPFPTACLPSPAREFVESAAQSIGCDQSYIALPLLTLIGGAIGLSRLLGISPDYWVSSIIWTMIIGESGSAKSPALKCVKQFAVKRQNDAYAAHQREYEEYLIRLDFYDKDKKRWQRESNTSDDPPKKPVEPKMKRSLIEDVTTEALATILLDNPRGVTSICDELAGWVGGFDRYSNGNADASRWLSLYDGDGFTVDRKTGTPKTILVKHGAVSITGGIQPGVLTKSFEAGLRASGMLARFLVTMPPQSAIRWNETSIPSDVMDAVRDMFDGLYELQPESCGDQEVNPVKIELAQDAKRAWVDAHNTIEFERAELEGELASVWAKLKGYVGRFALVIHCIRIATGDPTLKDPDVCDLRSMQSAIDLVDWFKHEQRRVYNWLSASSDVRQMQKLTEWIANKGGEVTVREVQQGHRRFKNSENARAALQELVDAGLGQWMPKASRPSGGRPSERFRLIAASTVYETPSTELETDGSVDVDTDDSSKFTDDDWEEV